MSRRAALPVPGALDEILIWVSCAFFGFGLLLLAGANWQHDWFWA